MSALQISLFGKLSVRQGGRPLDGFSAVKLQELLGYVLLYRSRPLSREHLATMLWCDNPPSQAKKQLRQVLWQLHAAFEHAVEPGDADILVVEPDWVSVNTASDVWLDVAALESMSARVTGVPGQDLDADAAAALETVIQTCEGDLLEGLSTDWCLFERERLREMYLAAQDKLMAYCEAQRLFERGIAHGESILRHDRARERTHRRMMRLYAQAGDRVAALRQYVRCATALEEELGVQPSRRTIVLYQQIRAESTSQQPDAALPTQPSISAGSLLASSPSASTGLADVLSDLQQVYAALRSVELRIESRIAAIEAALGRHRVSTPDDRGGSATRR